MAAFWTNVEQFLWDEVFGRSETKPKLFTMMDAWKFFMDTASGNANVDSCVINIEPKGDRFEITQLMLDKEGEILKADKNGYVGRRVVANDIDASVTKYMNGATRKTMRLPE